MKHQHIVQRIVFPRKDQNDWRGSLLSSLRNYQKGLIEIDSGEWVLKCRDIKELENICNNLDLDLISLESNIPETIVSASALGISSKLRLKKTESDISNLDKNPLNIIEESKLFFHQGTLRSGERLETDGDLLILGDVNPGAMVAAGGNVMIWGRLLGIAHAGKEGNIKAKITALQLRPLQIRIAQKVARGPKELPEEGFAEQAIVEKGLIVIRPANTK